MHFKQGAGRGPICRWQLPTDDVQIVDGVLLAGLHFCFLRQRWRFRQTAPNMANQNWRGRGAAGEPSGQRRADEGWGDICMHQGSKMI